MSALDEKIYFVNRLYSLIIEANLNTSDADLIINGDPEKDAFILQSLMLVRKLNTKAKAELNRSRFNEAQLAFEALIIQAGNRVEDFFSELLSEPENNNLVAFFRNYNNLSDEDKRKMLADKKILELIRRAKNKLDLNKEND